MMLIFNLDCFSSFVGLRLIMYLEDDFCFCGSVHRF